MRHAARFRSRGRGVLDAGLPVVVERDGGRLGYVTQELARGAVAVRLVGVAGPAEVCDPCEFRRATPADLRRIGRGSAG